MSETALITGATSGIGSKTLMKNKIFVIPGIKNKATILFSKIAPQKLILNVTENIMQ